MRGTGAPSRLIEGRGLRRTVRLAHLWLGLSVGALFVLLGLTGSALVFYPEIDALLNPEIAAGSDTPPDWDAALRTVRAAYPDKAGPWHFEVTDAPGAIPARYYDPAETAGRDFAPMMVWLSQDGSRILRRDYWGEYAVTFVYDLHYRLLLGESAGEVVGWLGFAMLALLASGLWAWWPMGSLGESVTLSAARPSSARVARLAQGCWADGAWATDPADKHGNHAGASRANRFGLGRGGTDGSRSRGARCPAHTSRQPAHRAQPGHRDRACRLARSAARMDRDTGRRARDLSVPNAGRGRSQLPLSAQLRPY